MVAQLFNPSARADAAAEMEFCELASFDAGGAGVFWSEQGGPSPWEMHPECDELLHVIEGEIAIEVLPTNGGQSEVHNVKTGWFLVVPKGCWHRQTILVRSKELYLTPGPTQHSHADDPRISSD